MPAERHQRSYRHIHRAQLVRAAEIRQIDNEARGDNVGADLPQQLHRAFGGAAGRDQVVNQDHALAGMNGIDMHFHLVGAVFERIGHPHGLMRQLAFLADRHKAG